MCMIKITWHNEPVPQNMKIKQVYGIVFNENGKILMRVENNNGKKNYSFGGGTPEVFDKDIEDTLRREMIEELNTTLQDKILYVGYQKIDLGDGRPFAQVRMTALIKNIGPKQPDPDGGEIYDRVFVSPKKAITLLNWGEEGKQQIEQAFRIAKECLEIPTIDDDEEIWI